MMYLQSYLESTLQSVFDNMSDDEMSDCLVIVFVAELDLDYVTRIGAQVSSSPFLWRISPTVYE
jgi:hypothetical protein